MYVGKKRWKRSEKYWFEIQPCLQKILERQYKANICLLTKSVWVLRDNIIKQKIMLNNKGEFTHELWI